MMEIYTVDITEQPFPDWEYCVNETGLKYMTRGGMTSIIKCDALAPEPIFEDRVDEKNKINKIFFDFGSAVVNDYKRMSPIIKHVPSSNTMYLMLTISSDYTLVRYSFTENRIKSIFSGVRNTNIEYYGCLMKLTPSFCDNCSIIVLDNKSDKFYKIRFSYNISTDSYSYIMNHVTDEGDCNALRTATISHKHSLRFKINPKTPITKHYVVPVSKAAKLHRMLTTECGIVKPIIYAIPDKVIGDKEIVLQLLRELQENKCRAITEYGIKLDFDIITELRLLYIFIMESTTNIKCIKSP